MCNNGVHPYLHLHAVFCHPQIIIHARQMPADTQWAHALRGADDPACETLVASTMLLSFYRHRHSCAALIILSLMPAAISRKAVLLVCQVKSEFCWDGMRRMPETCAGGSHCLLLEGKPVWVLKPAAQHVDYFIHRSNVNVTGILILIVDVLHALGGQGPIRQPDTVSAAVAATAAITCQGTAAL